MNSQKLISFVKRDSKVQESLQVDVHDLMLCIPTYEINENKDFFTLKLKQIKVDKNSFQDKIVIIREERMNKWD